MLFMGARKTYSTHVFFFFSSVDRAGFMCLYFPLGLERGNCVRQSFLVKLDELLKCIGLYYFL